MSSQNQFIARLEKQCQCRDSTQSTLVGNNLHIANVRKVVFTQELRKKCCFCVGLDRWRLNHQKARLMCILITAPKPAKWPMMFKGTKVLHHHHSSKKNQLILSPPLQPTLLQTLLSLASPSQRLQVRQCQPHQQLSLGSTFSPANDANSALCRRKCATDERLMS